MNFTYQTEVDQVAASGGQCPPANAAPVSRVAWRWVACTPSADCFLPQALRNPPRLLRATDPEEQCSCWAISMHDSLQSSSKAFKALEASFKRARKVFGGHVATALLSSHDGLCTPVDSRGHFDFHPFESYDFVRSFALHGAIS